MKRNLILYLILIINPVIHAQNDLKGTITDKATGEVIAGATVYIPELKTGTIADEKGRYILENLPKTKTVVQVSFLGYKSIVENVDLSTVHTLNFSMEQAVTEINEVVVTGTTRATEISQSPVPIITVNSRELLQNLNTNIIEAITKLPGVSAVTTGPNVSKPFIHGLGFNRVLTLFDGVRQEGQQWGDEHGIEVDENSVERIEIIKGPASLTYGSDALAGVVNLIPAPPVPNGTIKAHVEGNYQSNNNLLGFHTAFGGNNNGFIWGGEASHKQATNYQNKYDGRVYGTAFNETDFSGYVGLNKKWGYSDLNFSVFNDLQEIPDGSRDSLTRKFTKQISEADTFRPIVSNSELNSYKIAVLHQHIQHYRVYSSNNFILKNTKLRLIMGYQENIRREYSHPEAATIPGLYLDLKTFTYDIKFYLPEILGWEPTAGINGMFQKNVNKGTEFIIPDYRQLDIGPFILLTRTFNKIDLSGGVRFDARYFNNDPMYTLPNSVTGFDMKVSPPDTAGSVQPFHSYKNTFSGLSASFGAAYNFTKKFTLKANIARGFRAPNVAEISANGVHPGTLIYQIGNSDFKPEFSLQEDLAVSFRSNHVSGDLDLFNNRISNYIYNQKLLNHLGQDSVVVEGNQTFRFQQARAQLYGWEAFLDIHPYDWLSFENSVSATYALRRTPDGNRVTNDSTRYLPLIPPLHTYTELRANFQYKSKHFRSMYLRIGMEYYARQDRVYSAYGTETPTPGYLLFNAGAGVDITNNKDKVVASINILGNNIANRAYQSHLSRLKYFEEYPDNPTGRRGIYNMGRNIGFKLTVPLDFK